MLQCAVLLKETLPGYNVTNILILHNSHTEITKLILSSE